MVGAQRSSGPPGTRTLPHDPRPEVRAYGEENGPRCAESTADRQRSWGRNGQRNARQVWRHLDVQVLVAMPFRAAVGIVDLVLAMLPKPLGDVLIKAIRIIVAPIILTTIVVGIIGDLRQIAGLGLGLVYFQVLATLALLVGPGIGNLWPAGSARNADPRAFDPKAVTEFVNASPHKLLRIPAEHRALDSHRSVHQGRNLQILFLAVLFALALCSDRERIRSLADRLDRISVDLFGMVRIIMYFAPSGVLGTMALPLARMGQNRA